MESFEKYKKRFKQKYPNATEEQIRGAYDRGVAKAEARRKKEREESPAEIAARHRASRTGKSTRTVGQADVSRGAAGERAKREKEVGRKFTDEEWEEYQAKAKARRAAVTGREQQ